MNWPSSHRQCSPRIVAASCVLIVFLMSLSMVAPASANLSSSADGTQFSPDMSASSAATSPSNDTHTLSITADTSSRYAVIASGTANLTSQTREADDSVRQREIQGSISGNDSQDTVTFTGHIVAFQATENVTTTLDGQPVAPAVLNGSYIRFTNMDESNKGVYAISVNETIGPTGSLESEDTVTPNESSAMGTLAKNGDTDAYYYSGAIETSDFTGDGRVFINGQEVPLNNSSSSTSTTSLPTPTETTTPIDLEDTPFSISNLEVSNSEVVVGQSVVISVRVQNDRPKRVTAPVQFGAEGTVVGTREVALFAGDWQTVKITHTFDSPGNYTVKVGTLEQSVRVRESGQSGGIGGFTLPQLAIALVGSIAVALGGFRVLRWMN